MADKITENTTFSLSLIILLAGAIFSAGVAVAKNEATNDKLEIANARMDRMTTFYNAKFTDNELFQRQVTGDLAALKAYFGIKDKHE